MITLNLKNFCSTHVILQLYKFWRFLPNSNPNLVVCDLENMWTQWVFTKKYFLILSAIWRAALATQTYGSICSRACFVYIFKQSLLYKCESLSPNPDILMWYARERKPTTSALAAVRLNNLLEKLNNKSCTIFFIIPSAIS